MIDTSALREKVLDLAIRGKLVPQDPNDEPASVLLGRIRAEKEQMVKDGKLKAKDIKNDTVIFKGEDNLHYEKFSDGTVKCIEDEIPFDVPDGWAWCRLNSAVDVRDGTHDTPKYVSSGVPLITSKNLNEGGIDYSNVKFISEHDAKIINMRSGVDVGDILYAMIGTIGNPALIKENILISIKNVALFKFDYSLDLYNEYILLFLQYAQKDMKYNASGGLQPFVSLSYLRNYLVPIPPINEQRKISDIYKNIEKNIDTIENNKSATMDLISSIKSKILDLAIRGKLVPQDPNDEPASVLLERIKAEKEELIKQGKIKRDKKESVIFKGEDNSYYEKIGSEIINISDEIPFDIPDSWSWCRGYSCFAGMNSTKPTGDSFRYIDIDSIDNKIQKIRNAKTVPTKKAPSRASRDVENGSVLFSFVRPYLKNIAYVSKEYSDCIASTGFYICNSNGALDGEFMYYLMISDYVVKGLNQFMKGDNSPSITKDNIEGWLYPIPPLMEQKEICEKISALYTEVREIEKSLN